TGLALQTDTGQGRDGDIVLKLDPDIRADADIPAVQGQKIVKTRDFAHTIQIGEKALVAGWDYRAVAEGTATLLQALAGKDGAFALPRMKVRDWPGVDYTGVTVDLARQQIPLDAVKAVVDACRLWKIRYCQLHLTDDEGFTFPSTAFPKLGTKNQAAHDGLVPRVYTLKELKDLVAYADARGVTLVPELETPGHSDAMGRAMPEVFGPYKILDISSDEMYKALDTLVGEMCDVFKSSPYFHMGADEMYYFELESQPATAENLKKRGLKNLDEAFIQHVERMNESIRKRGKMTLAWEGVAIPGEGRGYKLPAPLTSQVICMCWFPWDYTGAIQQQGFTTITVPWDLGVPLSQWNMYVCNLTRLPATARLLGSSQTMSHMSGSALVSDYLGGELYGSTLEGYIYSLATRMERTWTPEAPLQEPEYQTRLTGARAMLGRLALPVKIAATGVERASWPVLGRQYFKDRVSVTLSVAPGAAAGEIRYSLDGSEPTAQSPLYAKPIAIEDLCTVNAALFREGRQAGHVSRAVYEPLPPLIGPITKWMLCGPYTKAGQTASELFDTAFDPEAAGQGEWTPIEGARLTLSNIPAFAGGHRVAYLQTTIVSPSARQACLYVSAADGVKVFLNGQAVHSANASRPAVSAEKIAVSLKEGPNRLLVKLVNAENPWQFGVKIRTADGGTVFLDEI
ncbi:MAG: family 20 glycosylhydrolase, partial [Planctomycetota bacterium]|nr:family 20 glycosylhydrolase [Planctomycetota bacterium]